jgi:hypothetical protein
MAAATLSGVRPPASNSRWRAASLSRQGQVGRLAAAAVERRVRGVQQQVGAVRVGQQRVHRRQGIGLGLAADSFVGAPAQRAQVVRRLAAAQLGQVQAGLVQRAPDGSRRLIDEHAHQGGPALVEGRRAAQGLGDLSDGGQAHPARAFGVEHEAQQVRAGLQREQRIVQVGQPADFDAHAASISSRSLRTWTDR